MEQNGGAVELHSHGTPFANRTASGSTDLVVHVQGSLPGGVVVTRESWEARDNNAEAISYAQPLGSIHPCSRQFPPEPGQTRHSEGAELIDRKWPMLND